MTFYRFEDYEERSLAPHLDKLGGGRVIEGKYIYFCKLSNVGGAGSEPHYHPNELLIFTLEGKVNALVGKDRRIIYPGTFIHLPPLALHQMKATEDGPMSYLYVKDRTWTTVGVAADEALPDHAPDLDEVAKQYQEGKWPGKEKDKDKSTALVEGFGTCYYPILDSLGAPPSSGNRIYSFEGANMVFGFHEFREEFQESIREGVHELFLYVLTGKLDAEVGDNRKEAGPGTIIHVSRGIPYCLSFSGGESIRYISVSSKETLENKLGDMDHSPQG
jgi:quercetin dioxygenase-like cupin family protein